jgi:hypothetical protein
MMPSSSSVSTQMTRALTCNEQLSYSCVVSLVVSADNVKTKFDNVTGLELERLQFCAF